MRCPTLTVLAAVFLTSPALADGRFRLEWNDEFLDARNIGDVTVTVLSGRVDHRDDCSLAPSQDTLDGQLYLTLGVAEAEERRKAVGTWKPGVFVPIALQPGDKINIGYGTTRCWVDTGEIRTLEIETDQGTVELNLQ